MTRALTLALILLAAPACAQTIDGDTFWHQGEKIRLWGIDAPETDQPCPVASERALRMMLNSARTVACTPMGKSYDRIVAICRADGQVINWQLVRLGYAFEDKRYSHGSYASAQEAAKRQGLGVWLEGCVKPWEWRER